MFLCFFYLLTVTATVSTAAVQPAFYTAAVYEHKVIYNTSISNRTDALDIMTRNLDIYEIQTLEARKLGADFIVFPEYGVTGFMPAGRADSKAYLETIPDPNVTKSCPCNTSSGHIKGKEVQYRLSCMAQNHSMYLAANIGDIQPCSRESDSDCPFDGAYMYNTDVVYDRDGCLVARYHKEHLFLVETLRWDKPKNPEFSYFDTEFGRFGVFICFDAVYKTPAVDLVTKYNVTNVIFSTAWINVLPHYVSTAYHSGWARTMKVNYLAANLHKLSPNANFIGSGIYGPNGILNYTFDRSTSEGHLVVAEVSVVPRSDLIAKNGIEAEERNVVNSDVEFSSRVFGDEFFFKELKGLQGSVDVCQNSVCCKLNFTRRSDDEMYALGTFDGMHFREGTYYLEVCLLVLCPGNKQSNCGINDEDSQQTKTIFSYFNLTGTMNTLYAFPEVVNADYNFNDTWNFSNFGFTKSITGQSDYPLISVTLMGRNFAKDGLQTKSGANSHSSLLLKAYYLLLSSTSYILQYIY